MRILTTDDVTTARVSMHRLLESVQDGDYSEAVNGLDVIEQTERAAAEFMTLCPRMPLMKSHLEAARSAGFVGAASKDCGREMFESCGSDA